MNHVYVATMCDRIFLRNENVQEKYLSLQTLIYVSGLIFMSHYFLLFSLFYQEDK
jgi:hypothetical protein